MDLGFNLQIGTQSRCGADSAATTEVHIRDPVQVNGPQDRLDGSSINRPTGGQTDDLARDRSLSGSGSGSTQAATVNGGRTVNQTDFTFSGAQGQRNVPNSDVQDTEEACLLDPPAGNQT